MSPWSVAYQTPPFMGFSSPEHWSGLPFPPPGDLPDPGIEPRSPALQADALLSELLGKPIVRGTRMKGWDIHRRRRSLVVVFVGFHPSCTFPRGGVIFVFSLDQKCHGMMSTSYP